MTKTTLNLVDIDFATQKASLLAFLQAQDRFKGFDFAGDDINVLIDILTINTQKNAFFLNMAVSEGFLDSAQLKNSIFSHAKELNYTPRSSRSSKANVTISFTATGESQPYIIQKGQSFTAQVKNQNFIFTIPETLTVSSPNTSFSFTTDIYEGNYVKDSYIFDSSTNPKSFKINNGSVDLDSLVVNVFEDDSVLGIVFSKTTSLLGLDSTSKIFFIQTNAADGNYEIMFGDGVMGYQPKNGSLIVLDYRISSGPKSIGSSIFTINFDPTIPSSDGGELTGNIDVVTNENALGGSLQEDIETTRFYAPRWFQTQERACVPSDFEVLLRTQFPEIEAVNVYGGETLIPPQFGKVIIALSLSNINGLPQSKQTTYYNFLKPRMMITEFPIFIEPDITYIDVTSTVKYNINLTTETNSRIKTLLLAAISDFNTTYLNNFNVIFHYSKFTSALDDADPSIISNSTDILLCKPVIPFFLYHSDLNIIEDFQTFSLNFTTPIQSKSLSSTLFTYQSDISKFVDDGFGNINIVKSSANSTIISNVGFVKYDIGYVQINDFKPDSFEGDSIYIYVKPVDRDISSQKNTILKILPEKVKLTISAVKE